jgi:hypothetical protein
MKEFLIKELEKEFNYKLKYDYEDMKILSIVQNYFTSWKITFDYEDILTLVLIIKNEWLKEYNTLTETKQAYIQQYCYDFLQDNEKDICNAFEEHCTIAF